MRPTQVEPLTRFAKHATDSVELFLRRRTLYPTELWMQGTVLPLVFSAIARFSNQTHADRRRQNRYKIRSSQSFDRLPSKSLFWLPWWTSFPFGHSLILHFICIFCYSAVSNRRFLRRRSLYPTELRVHVPENSVFSRVFRHLIVMILFSFLLTNRPVLGLSC